MKPAAAPLPNPLPAPRAQAEMPAMPALSLRVDRLVLHGTPFARHDGARIEQAFQHEVQRLVAAGTARLDRLGPQALAALRLDELRLDAGAGPDQLGRQLAAALLREIAP